MDRRNKYRNLFRCFVGLKSLVMFGLSLFIGWLIYFNFPDWIEVDPFISIKTTCLSLFCFSFLWFPKIFSYINRWWMLFLTSCLGGIVISAMLITMGCAFYFFAFFSVMAFLITAFLGTIFKKRLQKFSFPKFIQMIVWVVIVGSLFAITLFWTEYFRLANLLLYVFFSISVILFNVICFAVFDTFWLDTKKSPSEKHSEFKYVIMLYLILMASIFGVDSGRYISIAFYLVNLNGYILNKRIANLWKRNKNI